MIIHMYTQTQNFPYTYLFTYCNNKGKNGTRHTGKINLVTEDVPQVSIIEMRIGSYQLFFTH